MPAHLADRVPAVPALRALIRRRIQPVARALQPAHTPSVSPRQDSVQRCSITCGSRRYGNSIFTNTALTAKGDTQDGDQLSEVTAHYL